MGSFAIILMITSICAAQQALDLDFFLNKSVLLISAHPDDIEASVGGTVALLTDQGTQVYYAIVTNGDKGCANPLCYNFTSEEIAVIRQKEAYAAAAVLGVPESHVYMLDYEDGMVTTYPEIQIETDLIDIIRTVKPDVVMSWNGYPELDMVPSQWGDLGYHPDHQATGRLALESQFNAGVARFLPETGPSSWAIERYYQWAFKSSITTYSNITTVMQRKIENPAVMTMQLELLASTVAKNVGVTGLLQAEAFLAYY